MPILRDSIKRTTQAQLDGYRKWDLDAIMAPRADNCSYRYLPESMGRPAMNNAEFREYFATVLPLLTGFSVRGRASTRDLSAVKGESKLTCVAEPGLRGLR